MNRFFAWCASFFKKTAPIVHDFAPIAEQVAVHIDPKLQASIDKAQEAVDIACQARDAIEALRAEKKD